MRKLKVSYVSILNFNITWNIFRSFNYFRKYRFSHYHSIKVLMHLIRFMKLEMFSGKTIYDLIYVEFLNLNLVMYVSKNLIAFLWNIQIISIRNSVNNNAIQNENFFNSYKGKNATKMKKKKFWYWLYWNNFRSEILFQLCEK